jgi:hypothetical protein
MRPEVLTRMTAPNELHGDETATETHYEPHGAAAPHGAADDVAEHDMDEHDEPLGPLDIPTWAAGAAGVALGLVVAACLAFATTG